MKKHCKGKNRHVGESTDSFLKEEDIPKSVQTTAIKRALAMQLEEATKQRVEGKGPASGQIRRHAPGRANWSHLVVLVAPKDTLPSFAAETSGVPRIIQELQ
jgi:hypothetical protein